MNGKGQDWLTIGVVLGAGLILAVLLLHGASMLIRDAVAAGRRTVEERERKTFD